MVQPPSIPHDVSTDFDHHVVRFPTRPAAQVPTELPAHSGGRPTAGRQVGVRKHLIRQVVVLEVAGRLTDVVEDLDLAIQLALSDEPRGVVCDLSAVLEGAELAAVEMLTTAGRHVRDWPGIPVAVACPDPRVRAALAAHPLGRHLIVTPSTLTAVSVVLATPAVAVEWLRLAPHPTASRGSRDFVTRTLLDWGLSPLILSAGLVVGELVTSSTLHAGTDIDVSIAWNLGALRLTVRDKGPDLPRLRYSNFDVYGRGLPVVAGLSRAFGVLPTADGGKVVWAVLNAAWPRPLTSPSLPKPAYAGQESPMVTSPPGRPDWHSAPGPARTTTAHPVSPIAGWRLHVRPVRDLAHANPNDVPTSS